MISTENTTNENQLRALEEKILELTQEKGLRDSFVSTLVHDLRTPLASSRICAEILRERFQESPEVGKICEILIAELSRADGMVGRLLDHNRDAGGIHVPMLFKRADLDKLCQSYISGLTLLHGEARRFTYHSSGDVTGLWSKDCLHRILDNLVQNALKYGAPDRPITIEAMQVDRDVTLRVHNYGVPIPEKDQTVIFELFKQVALPEDRKQKGWGIGLGIVSRLVQIHGGSVEVVSGPEAGTSFTVRLPKEPR